LSIIQWRKGTASQWTTANPVLAVGEPGFETDTGKFKVGDGATAWTSLAYASGGGSLPGDLATIGGLTTAAFGRSLLTQASSAAARSTLGAKTVDATKTGIYQFEQSNTFVALSSLHTRRPFQITQTPSRFRLHIKNYDLIGNAYSSGTLTGVTAYIGAMAVDANGDLNGNFTATPTQIQTSTTLSSGTNEIVTGWISPGTFTINPYTWYGISVGWTATSQNVSIGGGVHWFTATPADAGVASPSGLSRVDNQGLLNMYIEYEYANDVAPVMLVVSNSLSGGGNVASVANRGEVDAWCGQWALTKGGVVATLAAGGAWTAHFPSTSTRWNYYSSLNTPLDPDFVVFFGITSSDVAGGTTVAATKTLLFDSIAKAKTLWPNAAIVLTTNPPRLGGGSSAALEANRKEINTWLVTCPGGALVCVDLEDLLTDNGAQMALTTSTATSLTLNGDTLPRLSDEADSGDHEHWSPRAAGRVAARMPPNRQVVG
jgi:hypothetical protein